MRKGYVLAVVCLFVSLFVYLFYRTEKTVVTQLFISITSLNKFVELRSIITNWLPLNQRVIYSLPEGLWVFCITLTSKKLFLKYRKLEISLRYLPLIFSIGLELLQLLHITNGRFDFWDIGYSLIFWLVANYLIPVKKSSQNILHPFNGRSIICITSYLIVYLAHVCK